MTPESETSSSQASFLPETNAIAFERPRTSPLYGIWLLVVTVVMVLLPVLYVGLLGLVGYGVYYHGSENFSRIMSWGGHSLNWRFQLFKFFIYFAPLFAGVILLLFMVKPLFAPRRSKAQPYGLNAEAEPQLFAFISGICKAVGAPAPRFIELDCSLNAAAGFRRGLRSMFGNDMMLVVGLPLVCNLTVEEFAGVLAHEFGHFSQGVGMRLSYIIRGINRWFARVVYERDALDEMLEEWGNEAEGMFSFCLVALAGIGVAISRTILHGLMLLGHFISSSMLRQMEFNADAYEIKLAGSETFEAAIRKFTLLSVATEQCYEQMKTLWDKERALPDNFPQLLANWVAEMPEEVKTRIDDRLGLQRTGAFDDHPCDADRIREARQMAEPGLVHDKNPATSLFASFQVPARFVTLFQYQELGIPITKEGLRSVTSAADQEEARAELKRARDRYFYGVLPLLQPLQFSGQAFLAPLDGTAALQQVKEFRPRLQAVAAQIAEVAATFSEAEKRQADAEVSLDLRRAGVEPPAEFGQGATVPELEAAIAQSKEIQEGAARSLKDVNEAILGHLSKTVSLLHLPTVANRLKDAENLKEESKKLASFATQFAKVHSALRQVRRQGIVLEIVLQTSGHDSAKANELSKGLHDLLYRLRDEAIYLSNPFASKKQSRCLFDQTVGALPASPEGPLVIKAAKQAAEGLMAVHEDVIGRLTQIAEHIESSLP